MRTTLLSILTLFAFCFSNLIQSQNTSPWPSTGDVGIGTTSPAPNNQLHVNRNGLGGSALRVSTDNDILGSGTWVELAVAKGNGNYSTLAQSEDIILRAAAGGNGRLLFTNVGYGSTIFATGGFGNETERMVITVDGNIGIGKNDPTDKLEVNGRIHARSVKVDLDGWPDYVFLPEYTLPSLEEVAQFIKDNGHLKNVPSAEEIESGGLDLGMMDKILMEKVEELTLYLLEKEEEIQEIKEEKEELAKTLEVLAKKVAALELKIKS